MIQGPGANIFAISGNNAVRIFYVMPNASLTMSGLAITLGHSSQGGAIYNDGRLDLSNMSISANYADTSGGIYNNYGSVLNVSSSTFYNNSSDWCCSAIFADRTVASTIANSTFYNNTSTRGGGGAIGSAGPMTIVNSTIAGNTTNQSTGGGVWNYQNLGSVTLKNTIVANNTNGNCAETITDGGGNLQYPGNDCGATIPVGDPKLGPLQDNGGPTWTMALLSGSLAIDAGDNPTCAGQPINNLDQRGETRPKDGDGNGTLICDIGPYEASTIIAFTPTKTPRPTNTPRSTSTPRPTKTPKSEVPGIAPTFPVK